MAAMVVAGKRAMNSASLLCVFLCFCQYLWWGTQVVEAQLKPGFYAKTCPRAEAIVRSGVQNAVGKEKRMGASLLRLHFHDCFVQGCDGSVLLDGSSGEKEAVPNNNSARGFDVVDSIKSQLESACPGTVSCADLLTLAARDSVVALGGPSWTVSLGRRDSRTSNQNAANNDIPGPNSTLAQLMSKFSAKGLNSNELVALVGSHTIGQARCFSFRSRIYNDLDIDRSFASALKSSCPSTSGNGDQNLAPLDLQTPTVFDNNYYKNLLVKKGLLHSDQQISTASLVQRYASNESAFFSDFVPAIIKMGNISPLTGSSGEIRKNCRRPN